MFGGGLSGIEMVLKNMGLGSVLDAARQLAESGAVEKIIQFADGLEETNARLARIEDHLGIKSSGGIAPLLIQGTATHLDEGGTLGTAEPNPNAAARGAA